MVKKMPSRDGNELEDPGCLLRQLEDAAPVVRSVRVIILYKSAAAFIRGRRLFEGGVYSWKYGIAKRVNTQNK